MTQTLRLVIPFNRFGIVSYSKLAATFQFSSKSLDLFHFCIHHYLRCTFSNLRSFKLKQKSDLWQNEGEMCNLS